MTAAQLHKMREGKRLADERRAREHVAQRHAFVGWIKDEALAHKTLTLARTFSGADSPATRAAQQHYNAVLRSAPAALPPDSAWAL